MQLIIESEHLEATRDGRVYTVGLSLRRRGNTVVTWYDKGWNLGSAPARMRDAWQDFRAGFRDGRRDT